MEKIVGEMAGRFEVACFGGDDYLTDIGVKRTKSEQELDYIRKYFAVHAHGLGLMSMDTPFIDFKDSDGLKNNLEYLKSIGMKSKCAIHPG